MAKDLMTPERWQEVEGIFQAAITRDPIERRSFVEHECAGDESLRKEVSAMLSVAEASRDFLGQSAFEVVAGNIAGRRDNQNEDRVIGHYRLKGILGTGGMGEVYQAIDERTNRKVALKLLPDYFNGDRQRVHRFEQEARALLALNHPNIVTTYEVGEVEGTSFIASEFIEGETLREIVARRQIEPLDALELLIQIAGALSAAHDAGVVHRDIKPENIMVRPDGYAKLLDFGVAKINPQASAQDMTKTHPGMIIGTVSYMSPEQTRGLIVDARSDLWSLGVVFYEMLCGIQPFKGNTPSDSIAAIIDKQPEPLQSHLPHLPAEMVWIVNRMLRKDREERYQTAKQLLGDLRELRRELDLRAVQKTHSTDSRDSTDEHQFVLPSARLVRANFFAKYKWLLAAGVIVFVLAAIAVAKFFPKKEQTLDSLAVLPFVNVANSDPNSEYLADGITESLINRLSQLPSVKVIARNSVFRYKVQGQQSAVPDPQKVAKDLGVQAVLIGRIIQRGDDLFVNVELVSAQDNSHIWGAQYNRKLADVFAVQEQIARDISSELRSKLGDAPSLPAKRGTENLKALEYYMQGRGYVHRRTREDLTLAGSYYQKAIEEDQNYALAFTGLAEVYGNLGVRGYISPGEGRRKLKEAAEKSVVLDDNLPEAHVMMGYYYMGYAPYDFPNAERELKRAIQLSPSLAIAHLYLSLSLLRQDRLDEGLNEMLKARELDPFSAIIARQLSLGYLLKRDYPRALNVLHEANSLGPPFITTTEIGCYVQSKLYDEALAAIEKEGVERKNDPLLIFSRGLVYAAQGRRAEAMKIIHQLEELSGSDYSQAQWIAKVYSELGDKEQAFAALERALSTGTLGVFYFNEPVWDNIRDDQRFVDLMLKVGLPQQG